jgi:hypothetical protein
MICSSGSFSGFSLFRGFLEVMITRMNGKEIQSPFL